MKNFFSSLLGSFLGVIIASVIGAFILIGLVAGAFSSLVKSKDKVQSISDNTVIHLKLDKKILERSSKNILDNFSFASFSTETPLGLNDILLDLRRAKEDSKIKGIYLDLSSVQSGIATLEEIRNALLDFKKSKKFIVSYSESYSQGAYYLATTADKVFLNPAGTIEWKGLSAQIMFYKGLLDKLDVNAQIFRHGKFKSAIEPFDLVKMSPANREQTMAYVGSIWNHIKEGVAAERHISISELSHLADGMMIQSAADAKTAGLADDLLYQDQVYKALNVLLKENENDKINFRTLEAYDKSPRKIDVSEPISKNRIAVIYAVGQIEGGEGNDNTIGSERISKAIREARLDENVKAIVL
ncbi:MAG TPA: S49 family peptidase, partial [Bacteroidia bacterium]|nr:S49 family peptidase [Bacteroidia bacterium]